MNNTDIYIQAFIKSFNISAEKLDHLSYNSIPAWDSVGHMVLISKLEEDFNILLDTEDIVNFSSFEVGKNILNKYNIEI